MMEEKL